MMRIILKEKQKNMNIVHIVVKITIQIRGSTMSKTNNEDDKSFLEYLGEHFTDDEMCEMVGDDEGWSYMENW